MKVYLPQDMSEVGKKYLTDRGYEIKLGTGDDEETMARQIVDCDAIIIRVAKLSGRVIAAAPGLKVIGRHGVGTDNIDLDTARALGIRVTNGPESNANSVAEHTVALMLALAHKLVKLDHAVHEDRWNVRNTHLGLMDLKGKTIGLIGFGHIARQVAKKLALGFEANVITWGSKHSELYPDYVRAADSLETLLKEADIVSLHCPLNDQTRGMMNEKTLAMMKKSAFLINTARGEHVCIQDLTDALREGRIAGYASDVYAPEYEMPPKELLEMENVVFTPHCAAHTVDGMNQMALHAAIGVHEVLSGREPTWPVI